MPAAVSLIAAVQVPDLPIQFERQRRKIDLPVFIPHPLDTAVVFARSPEAAAAGITPGMSLYQARQMLPAAVVVEPDEHAYHACHGAVQAALQRYTPLIETVALGEFLVDLRGLAAHGDTTALTNTLAAAAQAACGLIVQVGVANGKFTAEQAARAAPPGGGVIVPAGEEGRFLASLPLTVLPHFPGEIRRRLTLLDLHTLGDLAGLGKAAVLRQFGGEMSGLYELARGRDPRPINPDVPPLRLVRSLRLPGPVSHRPALLHATRRVSWQMAKVLNHKGFHAEGLKLTFYGADGSQYEIGQAAKPPTADEQRLYRLAALLLGKLTLKSPVVSVALSAYPLRAWHMGAHQQALTQAGVPEKQVQLESALHLLIHRFGDAVLRVAALLGPPRPLQVRVALADDGRPARFTLGDQLYVIVDVDNYWREERLWWDRPLRRDYFRVVLPDGSLRKLFQDLVTGGWYLDRAWPVL